MKIGVLTLILFLFAASVYAAEQMQMSEKREKVEAAGNKICPVSGEKIDETMKHTYEYKGKIYSFCCPACIEEFKKDPERYLEKIKQEDEKAPSRHDGHHHHHGH